MVDGFHLVVFATPALLHPGLPRRLARTVAWLGGRSGTLNSAVEVLRESAGLPGIPSHRGDIQIVPPTPRDLLGDAVAVGRIVYRGGDRVTAEAVTLLTYKPDALAEITEV